jgi:hypothetical protein
MPICGEAGAASMYQDVLRSPSMAFAGAPAVWARPYGS